MNGVFNQFSYPLIASGVLLVIFLLLRRRVKPAIILVTEIALLVIFIGGFFALRTGDGDLADMAGFDAVMANDRPTFIEFFSNFCTGCLVIRPTVDALITDINDDFNVLRVNIHSDAGRELRDRLGFSFTPEFLLLDANGIEVWRDHVPPSDDILGQAH